MMADSLKETSDDRFRISCGRIFAIVGVSVGGAVVFGVTQWVVSVQRNDISEVGLSFTLFSVVWFAIIGAVASGFVTWAVVIGRHLPEARRRTSRDSIERSHSQRARAGAFSDLIILVAVGLMAVTLFEMSLSAIFVLSLLLGIGNLDFAIRYWILTQRES